MTAQVVEICANLGDIESCSDLIAVQPGDPARLKAEISDLPSAGLDISPHTEVNTQFSVTVGAFDIYGNQSGDHTGKVPCEIWKGEALDSELIPSYTFTLGEKGSHTFDKAVAFQDVGEYSLVCVDDQNASINGALQSPLVNLIQLSSHRKLILSV